MSVIQPTLSTPVGDMAGFSNLIHSPQQVSVSGPHYPHWGETKDTLGGCMAGFSNYTEGSRSPRLSQGLLAANNYGCG